MKLLVDLMFQILNFFYALTGNYGWSIIFLTVAVNLALYPLTLQSIVQMAAMQKLQPKLKKLQDKHKDDPKKSQQEMMDLYKTEKVNPLGGCLPMLLKIPFFIALFFALTSKEFTLLISSKGAAASFFWLANLAKPDPTYILVVLIAVTTYYSQITMPSVQTDQTKSMTMFMPFFIAFISLSFPSGVQLYWVVSNAVAIAQQVYITRRFPQNHEIGDKIAK